MPDGDGAAHIDAASVDAAIAQVLLAEREAREAVAQCARDAEAMVEQAHQRARTIARHAAHRTVRVQRWSAEALKRRLDELTAGQAQAARTVEAAEDSPRLRRVIARLAAELTGAER
jgi:glycerol-3-phosphate O-acyltransferase